MEFTARQIEEAVIPTQRRERAEGNVRGVTENRLLRCDIITNIPVPCKLSVMSFGRTNDHLRSTAHRVVNKTGRDRYSVTFFFAPSFDTEVRSQYQHYQTSIVLFLYFFFVLDCHVRWGEIVVTGAAKAILRIRQTFPVTTAS